MHRQCQAYAGTKACSTRSHSLASSSLYATVPDTSKACGTVKGPRASGVKSKLDRNDSPTKGPFKYSLAASCHIAACSAYKF